MEQETDTKQRLAALPKRISAPFSQLLAKGLLAEETLITVLDAGDLAGDTDRLLGFAIAYAHMSGNGAPVGDAIRMAKGQGRKINLDWSEKRWRSEHDRLSRLETLNRLAGNDVVYDLSAYEVLLPNRFSGYLIKNSRRLGMEGLRQRHCVASYHERIQSGRCAIAAVFIDGKRWTVEITLTGDQLMPVCIGQIKTHLNGTPTSEIRERIHQELGIDSAAIRQVPADADRPYMENLRRLLPALREWNVEQVAVRFEGYGDSGSIETIRYSPDEADGVREHQTRYWKIVSSFDHEIGWTRQSQEITGSVDQAVEDLTYDYLEETDVDWYNNDGGFGELVIDVVDATVSLEVNINYTESNTAFSSDLDILTGVEV